MIKHIMLELSTARLSNIVFNSLSLEAMCFYVLSEEHCRKRQVYSEPEYKLEECQNVVMLAAADEPDALM